jgi:hypothetical protein
VVLLATLVLTLGGASLGYYLGHKMAMRPLADATKLIQQLQPENQKLKTATIDANAKLTSLQSKLTETQKELEAIRPLKDTYSVAPNQSIVVADGRLTVGLVGSPENQKIDMNINGRQQSAVSGDVFKISPEPSMNCQVKVQSFDMFKAIITAFCAKAQ